MDGKKYEEAEVDRHSRTGNVEINTDNEGEVSAAGVGSGRMKVHK